LSAFSCEQATSCIITGRHMCLVIKRTDRIRFMHASFQNTLLVTMHFWCSIMLVDGIFGAIGSK